MHRRAFLSSAAAAATGAEATYYPPPDAQGGWRRRESRAFDRAYEFIQSTTKHGGLLVAHRAWLVYERYFGRAHPEAAPNNASIAKSFTSIAAGIVMAEHRRLFPDGLDQRVFTPQLMPPVVFPLSDARKKDIRLGQLLAMTAGIRGNNPGYVGGRETSFDPPGPDGWQACVDEIAAGKTGGKLNTATLWCEPGGGWSYATSSVHLASMMVRHLAGMELEEFVRRKVAAPMGWGRFGWGYKQQIREHTPGGGGIAARPRDLLRFAYLLLHGGRWGGQTLVPSSFVHAATTPSSYNQHFDYSLQFDVNGRGRWPGLPPDLFWKTGSGGYAIFVVPSLDLAVYKMGGRDEQYDPSNTGIPLDPGFTYDGSREGWKATSSADAYRQTIQLVLEALKA